MALVEFRAVMMAQRSAVALVEFRAVMMAQRSAVALVEFRAVMIAQRSAQSWGVSELRRRRSAESPLRLRSKKQQTSSPNFT